MEVLGNKDVVPYGNFAKSEHEKIIMKGEEFTDPEFPPELSSLFSEEELKESNFKLDRAFAEEKVTWRRLPEIYPDFKIYEEEFSEKDVVEGMYEQSFMLVGCKRATKDMVSSMAIKKMFITKDPNTAGIYTLQTFIEGRPTTVTIDDFIPCLESSGTPVFLNSGNGCVWPLLIEKAFAKICGNYEKAHSCQADDFLSLISHSGISKSRHYQTTGAREIDHFWGNIKTAFANSYWLIAESVEFNKQCKELGISALKSFAIKGVFEEEEKEEPTRLILLNGYRGKDTWKGEWAKGSEKWTDDLKEKFELEDRKPGEFYVSFSEYLKYFQTTYFVLESPDLEMVTHLSGSQPKGSYTIFEIKPCERSEICFKITQPFTSKASPANTRLIICRDIEKNESVPEKYKHISGSFHRNERICYMEIPEHFQKDTYFVFVEFDEVETDFAITMSSNTLINAKTINNNDKPNFVLDVAKDYMTLSHNSYRCSDSYPNIHLKSYSGSLLGNYLVHHYKNESEVEVTYIENFKYPSLEDFEYQFEEYNEEGFANVKVEPGEEACRVVKKINPDAKADYTYSNSFIASDKENETQCHLRGNKKIIKTKAVPESQCYVKTHTHDGGYVFLFENNEEERTLDALLIFTKTTNIEPDKAIVDDKGQKCWHIVLEPGKYEYRHARRHDFSFKFAIAHKSSYALLEPGEEPRKV